MRVELFLISFSCSLWIFEQDLNMSWSVSVINWGTSLLLLLFEGEFLHDAVICRL